MFRSKLNLHQTQFTLSIQTVHLLFGCALEIVVIDVETYTTAEMNDRFDWNGAEVYRRY